jgi:hypothetical protein
MRGLIIRQFMSVQTRKSLRMERPLQVLVAFLLAEQLVNRKSNHPDVSSVVFWNMPGKFVPSR